MAKPVWQQKLQAKLDANPLYYLNDSFGEVKCQRCLLPGEKGKKVSLRYCVNYLVNTCKVCGAAYR